MYTTRKTQLPVIVMALVVTGSLLLFLACGTPSGGGSGQPPVEDVAPREEPEDSSTNGETIEAGDANTDGDTDVGQDVQPAGDDDASDVEDEAEDALAITFPETGDAVMILEDSEAGAGVTCFGTADPGAEDITFSGFDVDLDDETTKLVLDDQERPAGITLGSLNLGVEYHEDGTVDYVITQDGAVVSEGFNVALDEFEVDDPMFDGSDGAAAKAIAAECVERTLQDFANLAIRARGWKSHDKYSRDELPIKDCVRDDPEAQRLAKTWCFLLETLGGSFAESALKDCKSRGLSDDYCRIFIMKAGEKLAGYTRLIEMLGSLGVADSYWDDPDCGCPARTCPSRFVCTDGQCVPRCTRDTCPEGLYCHTDTGQCLAEPECNTAADCDDSEECTDHYCVPGPEPFQIASVAYTSSVTSDGDRGDLTVTWSGDPVFPVVMKYRVQEDGCPPGLWCTSPAKRFDTRINPLVFPEAVWCSGVDKTLTFGYDVVLIDNAGVETPPYAAPFTCQPRETEP